MLYKYYNLYYNLYFKCSVHMSFPSNELIMRYYDKMTMIELHQAGYSWHLQFQF